MKIQDRFKMTLLAAVAGLVFLPSANAALVNVTSADYPDIITLSGHSTPTASEALLEKGPNGTPSEFATLLATQLPLGAPYTSLYTSPENPSASFDFSSYGGDYMVVHWGAGNAGKFFTSGLGGGFYEIFYIEPGTGTVSIALPNFSGDYKNGGSATIHTGTLNVGGLSGFRIFGATTSVPEPSTIVAGALLLLPFGVSTIRILRKNRQA